MAIGPDHYEQSPDRTYAVRVRERPGALWASLPKYLIFVCAGRLCRRTTKRKRFSGWYLPASRKCCAPQQKKRNSGPVRPSEPHKKVLPKCTIDRMLIAQLQALVNNQRIARRIWRIWPPLVGPLSCSRLRTVPLLYCSVEKRWRPGQKCSRIEPCAARNRCACRRI